MKPRFGFVLVVALVQNLQAQVEFTFSGYVMEIPFAERMNAKSAEFLHTDREQTLNVARLRLRPTLTPWENGQLSVEYEVTYLYHSAKLFFSIENGQNRRQVVDLTWNPVNESRLMVLHFVDRLHFSQGLGSWDLVVGRQRVAWGTGRIWNPTDLFNPINPTSFAKIEKDGIDAVVAKFHFSNFTDLAVVYNPQKGWTRRNSGFRFRSNYREFDVSFLGGRFDQRVILGGDFAGNLWDAGVRGEGIFSAHAESFDSNFVKLIFGIDYQFTSEFYGLVEYHFNGEGRCDKFGYNLRLLASGEILNVGRNYMAAQGSYLLHPLVTTSATLVLNVNDRSKFLALSVTYAASEEISLALGGQLFSGEEFTEYWYYPHSMYLKADFFF